MVGRIMRHRAVVADQVDISIARDHRKDGDQANWWGEVWLSTATHVFPGDELTLELEDTGPTAIVIERVTVDTKAGKLLVRFTGKGPLASPREAPE